MNSLITLSTVWNQFSGKIKYCLEWVFPITLNTVWNEITEIFWVLFGITLSTNFNEISEILTTVWNELSVFILTTVWNELFSDWLRKGEGN